MNTLIGFPAVASVSDTEALKLREARIALRVLVEKWWCRAEARRSARALRRAITLWPEKAGQQ